MTNTNDSIAKKPLIFDFLAPGALRPTAQVRVDATAALSKYLEAREASLEPTIRLSRLADRIRDVAKFHRSLKWIVGIDIARNSTPADGAIKLIQAPTSSLTRIEKDILAAFSAGRIPKWLELDRYMDDEVLANAQVFKDFATAAKNFQSRRYTGAARQSVIDSSYDRAIQALGELQDDDLPSHLRTLYRVGTDEHTTRLFINIVGCREIDSVQTIFPLLGERNGLTPHRQEAHRDVEAGIRSLNIGSAAKRELLGLVVDTQHLNRDAGIAIA